MQSAINNCVFVLTSQIFPNRLGAVSKMENISSVNIHYVEAIERQVEPENIGWLLLDIDKDCTRGETIVELILSVSTVQLGPYFEVIASLN
jgi:hypothetical protein